MDVREKLVELICKGTVYDRYLDRSRPRGCHGYTADVLADYLLANGVTVQEWIPVTERLPKNDYEKPWWERQRYLVRLQGGSMRVATYGYKEADWWIDSHDCVLHVRHHTAVTHWMLAPTPPKGE